MKYVVIIVGRKRNIFERSLRKLEQHGKTITVYLRATQLEPLYCNDYGCVFPFNVASHPFSGYWEALSPELAKQFFSDLYNIILSYLKIQYPEIYDLAIKAQEHGARLVFEKPLLVEIPVDELKELVIKYAEKTGKILI